MKKKNFSKKLNLNKTIVSKLTSFHMLKINGGSGVAEEELIGDETYDCNDIVDTSTCSGEEPQAASILIASGGNI
jgi:hypothetical protein